MRVIGMGTVVVLLGCGAAACAAKSGRVDGAVTAATMAAAPVRATIVVRRDPKDRDKCISRTIPKRMEVDYGVDHRISWSVRQVPGANCLPEGVELELRWDTGNPTACVNLGTSRGNKVKFDCDLGTYLPGGVYAYKVYRVGKNLGSGELMEDPDIEIVEF